MLQKEYNETFDNIECEIRDKCNNQVVMKVDMISSKVFQLRMLCCESYGLKTTCDNISLPWHLRYSWLNFKNFALLKQKNMVLGSPLIN